MMLLVIDTMQITQILLTLSNYAAKLEKRVNKRKIAHPNIPTHMEVGKLDVGESELGQANGCEFVAIQLADLALSATPSK